MVNNNFYSTVNELVNRASKGTFAAVTDYASFIDAGKSLANMDQGDKDNFMNAFAAEIANKIKLTIDTARQYVGKYRSLIRGSLAPNAVIEVITHGFFETRQALFVNLVDGQSVDMYTINKGTQSVDYYIKDIAYQIPVTIQYTELEGAFNSPEQMGRFLNDKIMYALNSNEFAREQARLGLMADLIVELSGATAADSADAPAQRYKLVELYNDINGTTLTANDALYNSEFVRFAVSIIKKVRAKMRERSDAFNSAGVDTFTPENASNLYVLSALDSGIASYLYQDARRPESLGDYETVSYWQTQGDPFTVKSSAVLEYANQAAFPAAASADQTKVYLAKDTGKTYTSNGTAYSETTTDLDTSPAVVAVLCDEYAVGEYVCHEAVHTTPFNAVGEYFNNWINVQLKEVRVKPANAVIFTLEAE